MEIKEKLEDNYIIQDGKKLRFGYTTGSCATAAAKAAATILLTGEMVDQVDLLTPMGIFLHLEVLDVKKEYHEAELQSVSCAIRKDAGDDPDVTNGTLIYATVKRDSGGDIQIRGGAGIGKVTRPGLDQPVGEWAINQVPRQTITLELEQLCMGYGYGGGLVVTISVPEGEALTKNTFNPRLGIQGGISILGTSGIVVPMSEEALLASIELEMKQRVEGGETTLLITPGNYGKKFAKEMLQKTPSLFCSNYVGETLDMAVQMGVKEVLFVAHLGKFIKVAGGIMNTHSREADCRMDILASCVLEASVKMNGERPNKEPPNQELPNLPDKELLALLQKVTTSQTTEEAVDHLEETGMLQITMEMVKKRILHYMNRRIHDAVKLDVIIFTNQHGRLL